MPDYLFVGFNRRVAALDRRTGEILWSWKAPKGTGYVSILPDGDLLFVSVHGYTYALDPTNGMEMWANPMSGFGVGVTCLATARSNTNHGMLAQSAAEAAQAAASANTGHAGM